LASQKSRDFGALSREEKKDFILYVAMLKTEVEAKSQSISYKELSLLARSRLHVQIAPSTLGNILRRGGYPPYLLYREGLDERFRREYDFQEIEVLRLIPVVPNPESSHLYDAHLKGVPTQRAKEIIDKLESDGLIRRSPDGQGYSYYYYSKTGLGKELLEAIDSSKYKLNLANSVYIRTTV
jgi:hypothetical protein